MTRVEIIRAVAEVIAGLQVPASIGVPLGTAEEPWRALFNELHYVGWTNADELESTLTERLAVA